MVVIKYGYDQIMTNFTKSILVVKYRVMTGERCLIRALLIILILILNNKY